MRYQPPLRLRSHVWRYALCLAISAIAWGETAPRQWEHEQGLFWLDVALGTIAYVLVAFRRRWPLGMAIALNAMAAVSGLAAGPATLAAVSLATRRVFWQVVLVGLVGLAAGQTFVTIEPGSGEEPYWLDLTVNAVFTAGILAWGMYIGSRRELLWTLRDQVARAAEEQEIRAREARTGERARIAREMHDVLAHRISQVSMHANALMFREDLTAAQMRDSVAVIQEKANEALTDLRNVLGVLRDPSGALLDKPQPTYTDLPALIEEVRAGGTKIEYVDHLAAGAQVPDATGRTIYRIVQEGLTNARKHAPGAAVTVTVSGSETDGLEVVLRNPVGFGPSAVPGSGLGLVGLRERAELAGGRLEARMDVSTFELRLSIPWET